MMESDDQKRSFNCPFCSLSVANTLDRTGKETIPQPGTLALCVGCGEWFLFDADAKPRKPTDQEYDLIASDKGCQDARAAWVRTQSNTLDPMGHSVSELCQLSDEQRSEMIDDVSALCRKWTDLERTPVVGVTGTLNEADEAIVYLDRGTEIARLIGSTAAAKGLAYAPEDRRPLCLIAYKVAFERGLADLIKLLKEI